MHGLANECSTSKLWLSFGTNFGHRQIGIICEKQAEASSEEKRLKSKQYLSKHKPCLGWFSKLYKRSDQPKSLTDDNSHSRSIQCHSTYVDMLTNLIQDLIPQASSSKGQKKAD